MSGSLKKKRTLEYKLHSSPEFSEVREAYRRVGIVT